MVLTVPTALDVVRFVNPEVDQIVESLTRFYEDSAGWTYWPARSSAMPAFSGQISLGAVVGACDRGHLLGRPWNIEAGKLVWAAGRGREVKCFKIKWRPFAIRPDLSFRVNPLFFFVESGAVKIFFLQPRRGYNPTVKGLGVLATILRMTYKDDFDTFDVEILDLSRPAGAKAREARTYNFANLPPLSEDAVRNELERFATAFDIVRERGVQRPERRKRPEDDRQQPIRF